MKFAHFADCHIGGWKEEKMKQLNYNSFSKAIDEIIQERVDFLLVSGDLFNTSFPTIDALKLVVSKFKLLKNNNIPIYFIAGSHDFSPSGKTMLDVIEEAGLAKDVMRGTVDNNKLKLNFTIDEKSKTKITGIIGKRGMLDKKYYEMLDREIENENGFKIFMFHTTLTELKPKAMEKSDSTEISFLPKNFNYYAGGHVHITRSVDIDGYKNVVYPGPIFPNNFSEIEELNYGSYALYDNGKIEIKKIKIIEHLLINIEFKEKNPSEINELIKEKMVDVKDKLITIRLKGKLINGKITDIDFKTIFNEAYNNGAYFIMRNTNAVVLDKLDEIKINISSIENVEENIVKEHIGNIKNNFSDEKEITLSLIKLLDTEKNEGEKNADFEKRIIDDIDKIVNF
jgi:DNA repair protein SbcD/Mre11